GCRSGLRMRPRTSGIPNVDILERHPGAIYLGLNGHLEGLRRGVCCSRSSSVEVDDLTLPREGTSRLRPTAPPARTGFTSRGSLGKSPLSWNRQVICS